MFMNMRRLRHLKRCNNYPTIMNEDVAQHSYYVTLLAKLFYDEANSLGVELDLGLLLSKCLVHDMEESFVSDIPYPIKHANDNFHDDLEKVVDKGMSLMIGEDLDTKIWDVERKSCKTGVEGSIVALCDMLELAIFCYEECRLGNTYCSGLLDNCRKYLPSLFEKAVKSVFENLIDQSRNIDEFGKDYLSSFYDLYSMVMKKDLKSSIGEMIDIA